MRLRTNIKDHHLFLPRRPRFSASEASTSRRLIILLSLVTFFIIPAAGYAQDNCTDLSNNIEWTSGLQEIIMTMQAGDMPKAQQQAKALADICMNAPLLNYLQGKIAEELDQKKEALFYYQKASENTYTFAIAPDTAKKIWYARYESEFPEHTEAVVAASKTRIAELEAELSSEKAETQKLNEQLNSQRGTLISDFKEREHETFLKFMWAGAGIGIAGVAIAGGGVGMLFGSKHDKYAKVNFSDIGGADKTSENIDDAVHSYKYNSLYLASWAMIGAGAALAISGAVLTGIYGYKYTHPSEDESFAFQISPCDISFKFTF